MDAFKPTDKPNIFKARLTLLLIFWIIFSVLVTGYFKEYNGYYGFQDAVNYEKSYEKFRFDITHWMTIYLMDIFGIRWFPIMLVCVLMPYAFVNYYNKKGLNGFKKTFEFYLYSPFMLLLLHENVYAQLLFTLFFILYLTYNKTIFMVLGILAHPAFIILFIVQMMLDKKYKTLLLMMLIGVVFYTQFTSYKGYNFLNQNAPDETNLVDVFLYMNPINVVMMPLTLHNIIYNIIGLFFHNGRFMIYAVILQYFHKITKSGKAYGLILNILAYYNLLTVL